MVFPSSARTTTRSTTRSATTRRASATVVVCLVVALTALVAGWWAETSWLDRPCVPTAAARAADAPAGLPFDPAAPRTCR